MHTALLVIDVQQGLCEGPEAAHGCPGTTERINSVTHRARVAGVPVFFIEHELFVRVDGAGLCPQRLVCGAIRSANGCGRAVVESRF